MKKFLLLPALLLYFLVILIFFPAGALISGMAGVAEGQGLAGGAIVLGYGVLAAGLAWIASLFLVAYASRETLVRVNKLLGVVLLVLAAWLLMRYLSADKGTEEGHLSRAAPMARTVALIDEAEDPGLGFFKPNFIDNVVLHFTGNPLYSVDRYTTEAYDSLVFRKTEYGNIDIGYAPPWFVPEHLLLDYEILYLRIVSIGRYHVEVVVNTSTGQTAFIPREEGEVIFWEDFLLRVFTVDLAEGSDQQIRIKPLDHASAMQTEYVFLQPTLIHGDWMAVELMNEDFESQGVGWVKWREDGQLLITYSLLS